MSFLERLKKAGKSTNKDYTSFIRLYNKLKPTIHIFYEGYEDPSFYGGAIREVLNDSRKVYYHRASNKKQVYKYYDLIDWRSYSRNRVLFLVDKDYSDLLSEKYPTGDNIYVTDYYSIENYVVNKTTLERFLIEHCRGNDPDLILDVQELFHESYESFVEEAKLLIGYILYHKKRGGATQLNNLNLNYLYHFENDTLHVTSITKPDNQGKVQHLDNRVQVVTPTGAWKEIRNEIKSIEMILEHKIWLRGKFDLWFFIQFINKCIITLKNHADVNLRNPQISASNAILLLSPLTDKPDTLIQFLQERLH